MERLFGAAFGGGLGGLVGAALAAATCKKNPSSAFDFSYVCNPGPRLYESMEAAFAAHAGFVGLLFLIAGAWLSNRKSKP